MPTTKLNTYTVEYHNQEEYHSIKREIFTELVYFFKSDTPTPLIIDAGAHIGLATLYFKYLFPQATIIALEPHPLNFKLLTNNIWLNNLSNVHPMQVALVTHNNTHTQLHTDSNQQWLSTTSIHAQAWNAQQHTQPITVPALTLAQLISEQNRDINVLKLDIEGAELAVLKHTSSVLQKVRTLIIEFHATPATPLSQLLHTLHTQNFIIENEAEYDPNLGRYGHTLVVITAHRS